MNDRAVSLFEHYDLNINRTKKGRGVIIAETKEGAKVLMEYKSYSEKIQLQEALMSHIIKCGFPNIDCFIRNKEDELLVRDWDGKTYAVKDQLGGREINVTDVSECVLAAGEMANLHKAMENYCVEYPVNINSEAIKNEFEKRNSELRRVRNFIRKCSVKREFEILFLKEYNTFIEQAEKAGEFLNDEVAEKLYKKVLEKATFIHGDCSHHNLLIEDDQINIINFEKFRQDVQIKDLTLFLRKACEKNNWSFSFGMKILEAYNAVLPMEEEEIAYLYARLLYPEKFWKIANSYLNQRKSLPAKRQYDKLRKLLDSETKRLEFLNSFQEKYGIYN